MIFVLAIFSAIIIDWTDKNTADDANVLVKSHEKLRRQMLPGVALQIAEM